MAGMTRAEVIERFFLSNRARLIDIAAFMDRVDRAGSAQEAEDFRMLAMRKAIDVLRDGRGERARRVLEVFSDPTDTPIDSAAGMKAAQGAWPGEAAAGDES